jgi:hypothetical protein
LEVEPPSTRSKQGTPGLKHTYKQGRLGGAHAFSPRTPKLKWVRRVSPSPLGFSPNLRGVSPDAGRRRPNESGGGPNRRDLRPNGGSVSPIASSVSPNSAGLRPNRLDVFPNRSGLRPPGVSGPRRVPRGHRTSAYTLESQAPSTRSACRRPAQRAGRTQPRAEAEGRCPGWRESERGSGAESAGGVDAVLAGSNKSRVMIESRFHNEGPRPSLPRRCAMAKNSDAFDDLPCFHAHQ